MKKLLTLASIAGLFLPSLTFAAYNDVSLTTDAVLSVNSITLNVSGSAATIESIEVGSTDFIITLQSGSSFEVTAPNLNKLTTNQQLGLNIDACSGTMSKIGYTASSSQIVATITPSATLCASPAADTSGGTGSSGGGGGGGNSTVTATTPITSVLSTASITPEAKAAAILTIKVQLTSLIQQLLVLLNQQLQSMQAGSGTY